MTNNFIFTEFINPNKHVEWNPDKAQNGHLMITGGSGAGKTRLAKVLMQYLHSRKKNIHVIDIQNTLGLGDIEKVFKFEMRNSRYSINPFEFMLDEQDGGPFAQIDDIMEMFRKTFMKRLKSAPNLSAVLRKLIVDTYHKKGIIDSDTTTWGFGLLKAELHTKLPIMQDMKELVDYILDYVSGGYGAKFSNVIAKNGTKLNGWHNTLSQLQEELKKLNTISSESDELKREKLRINLEISNLQETIQKNCVNLSDYFMEYINYSFLNGDVPTYEKLTDCTEDSYQWLDYKFYSDRDRLKSIRTIETYLQALNGVGVFGRATPDISFSHINRYDISSIKDEPQLFVADTLISKIYRLIYLRGEYMKLTEGMTPYKTRLPQTTTDTCILIDEIQALLPDTAAEMNLKNNLYNRLISQVRNFGGFLIAISQTPANFPELYHINMGTKIILHTAPSDIPKVKQVTGIKDMTLFKHLEHKNKSGHYDVALMKDRVGEWKSVRLPWFEE